MKFKTKIAYSAVLATLGMVAGSAQAAFLSEAGTGQVLLYPYYTVQNGYDTYVSVVNTTGSAKAVKVRFIEAMASREVLDFNLYLSPYDVWTGAVTTTADGNGALLRTGDKSCTSPQITGDVPFRNGAYTTQNDDILTDDLSRTREGYIEMIEMGDLGVPVAYAAPAVGGNLAWRVTHATSGANIGLPNDCAYVTTQWVNFGVSDGFATTGDLAILPPIGGLFGSATLINVAQGTDYSYDPVAIEDFSPTLALHTRPGSLLPKLGNAFPVSTIMRATPGATNSRQAVITNWGLGRGVDAISAVLMHSAVMNEYAIDSAINAGTDWVVTFPTKSLYVPPVGSPLFNASTFGSFSAPFTKPARTSSNSTVWAACEPVTMGLYDREEKKPSGNIDFSPAPITGNTLCWESNVITFNNSKVLGSLNVPMSLTSPYQNGWMSLTFTGNQALVSPLNQTTIINPATLTYLTSTTTYFGLPVVGFAVEKYVNGNVGGVLSNYGGAFIHKYMRAFNDVIVQTPGSI